MNKSSKINVNASSLVGLKAELFKKQEQLKRDRLQPGSSASSSKNRHGESKKPSIWNKKNAGVKQRAEKDLEQLANERDELDNARNKLEAKAKFYEKMTKDGFIPENDSDERFLVDFERKALDQREEFKRRVEELEREEETNEKEIPPPANPDEEWVDYTDTLGRSRRCMRKDLPNLVSMDKRLNPEVYKEQEKEAEKKKEDLPDLMSNDMYREMLRKKWEEEEEQAAKGPLGSTHYQNLKYDEVRDMGVGYFDFSKDQTERNEQMDTLQLLRDETMGQRERREKLKLKRKAAMIARLEKIKERKRQKGEVIEDEEEKEEEKEEKEDKRLTEGVEKDTKPKESKVREWDIGKEPVSAWEQRLTNMRDERPAEFAPPSIYNTASHRRGQNQPPLYPPPKDYNSTFPNITTERTVKKPFTPRSSDISPPDVGYQDSSLDAGQRSKMSLPPPRDYSSVYGRVKETTGQKSSTATWSQWNAPSGSLELNRPFATGGGFGCTSSGGTSERTTTANTPTATVESVDTRVEDSEGAIASALSFFRKNAGK
ncbi:coiled-coil domain-containing protein 174-like [Lytechinus variegatus]|uniref:coiled-coil domain-containing protein 174-like n=1 Tax=Lytechinus variegatus TaxID=7654 RepID=UPI001BB21085|nr:coiled-coil domain-containing protein 174-like [Lytechinus variegatus]